MARRIGISTKNLFAGFFLLSADALTVVPRHVCQQFLQPGLPLLDTMEPQSTSWVQQCHRCIAVQLLEATTEGPAALLQQSAQLCFQVLTLADQMGLASILQEGGSRHIAGRTWAHLKNMNKVKDSGDVRTYLAFFKLLGAVILGQENPPKEPRN